MTVAYLNNTKKTAQPVSQKNDTEAKKEEYNLNRFTIF